MYDFKDKQTPWIDLDINKVVIGSGVTTIGDYAFTSYSKCLEEVTEIVLPNTLKEIGHRAFAASRATKIDIPASVTFIDSYAFAESAVASVIIPKGVKSIKSYTFYKCANLKEVEIEEGVVDISASVFSFCTSLEELTIYGESLEFIGGSAFADCTSLKFVALPNSVTEINICVFANCSSLKLVYLPLHMPTIPQLTFTNCSSLEAVLLPESLTTVESNAFQNCNSLVEVYFPGTEDQLSQISVASGNDPLLYADVYLVTMITEQPADQTVKAGEKVTFHAEASREGCTYQWYCLAPDSDEWVACTQSGNKTDTLSFTATKDLDGYYFLCEITDPYGNSGDTEAALLTVK